LEKKDGIQGHAVQYPLEFLIDENIKERFLYKEVFVPEIAFV
jgi:hypothetical protein